jgi:hypothetical protein
MTPTEIIKKLRQTFDELQKMGAEVPKKEDEKENVKMSKKLADGTEIEVTDWAVGGIVTINGTPAPTGEHTLDDGTIVVVGENGAITEIKPAQQQQPAGIPPSEAEDMAKKLGMSEEFTKFQDTANQKFADYEGKFSAYEQKFADYEERLSKATKVIEGLLNLTQTLADTPTGIPDQSVKNTNNFKAEKQESLDILFS